LAAVILAPASAGVAAADKDAAAGVSFFVSALGAAGTPIERTFAFGLGASPPMLRTFGAPSFVVTGLFNSEELAEPSAGRFAIVGVGFGACCGVADAAWGC
jgi:hypothetical protein